MDKNYGTLKQIFCCISFRGNHCKQAISVALNETTAAVSGSFGSVALFLSKLLQLCQV